LHANCKDIVKRVRFLINASHDKEFVFHDGSRAKNLPELVLKIDAISDHEFHQFVNQHKNDFANWTEHVLADKHLAEKLRAILSKTETSRLIKDKINELTVGSSIIKIPRIEDHRENNTQTTEHAAEHHEVHHEIHHEEPGPTEHHVEHQAAHNAEHNVKHHGLNHGLIFHHLSKKPVSTEDGHQEEVHSSREEKTAELKARHNWFELFSRKKLSEQNLVKIEREEEDKLSAERDLKEELDRTGRENALWVTLYFALVLLIITLLIYKLFL
jgi:hypothetical protein